MGSSDCQLHSLSCVCWGEGGVGVRIQRPLSVRVHVRLTLQCRGRAGGGGGACARSYGGGGEERGTGAESPNTTELVDLRLVSMIEA